MTSYKCKLLHEGSKLVHELSNQCYQSGLSIDEPSKLDHPFTKPTWHVAHLLHDSGPLHSSTFVNLPNQFHKYVHTMWFPYSQLLNFLPPHFAFFAFYYSLIYLCCVLTWKPLKWTLLFLWSFIMVSQSRKQVVSVFLYIRLRNL